MEEEWIDSQLPSADLTITLGELVFFLESGKSNARIHSWEYFCEEYINEPQGYEGGETVDSIAKAQAALITSLNDIDSPSGVMENIGLVTQAISELVEAVGKELTGHLTKGWIMTGTLSAGLEVDFVNQKVTWPESILGYPIPGPEADPDGVRLLFDFHLLKGEARFDLTGSLTGRYEDAENCWVKNVKTLTFVTELESYIVASKYRAGTFPPKFLPRFRDNFFPPKKNSVTIGKGSSEHRVPCGKRCDCAPSQTTGI